MHVFLGHISYTNFCVYPYVDLGPTFCRFKYICIRLCHYNNFWYVVLGQLYYTNFCLYPYVDLGPTFGKLK